MLLKLIWPQGYNNVKQLFFTHNVESIGIKLKKQLACILEILGQSLGFALRLQKFEKVGHSEIVQMSHIPSYCFLISQKHMKQTPSTILSFKKIVEIILVSATHFITPLPGNWIAHGWGK